VKEEIVTRVTPRGVSDGDPGALSAVCARRGPAVLAYCEQVCPGQAQGAAADAFSAFRAGVVKSSDPLTLDPDTLLLHATRRAAAARAPEPEPARRGLRRRLSGRRAARPCEMVSELLVARAHGSLSAADEERLADHLEHCPPCRGAAERFESAERIYRDPPSRPLAPAVTEALVEALLSAAPVRPQTLHHAAPVNGSKTNSNGATPSDGVSEDLSAEASAPLPADSHHGGPARDLPEDQTTAEDLATPHAHPVLEDPAEPHHHTTIEDPVEPPHSGVDRDPGVDEPAEPISAPPEHGGSFPGADQTAVASPLRVEQAASELVPDQWPAGDDEKAWEPEPGSPSRIGVMGSWRLGRELPRSRRRDGPHEIDHGHHGWAYRLGFPAMVVLGALAATLAVAGVFAGGAAHHQGGASFVRPLSSFPAPSTSVPTDSASSGPPAPSPHRRRPHHRRAGSTTPFVRRPTSAAVTSSPRHYRLAAHSVTVPSASSSTPTPQRAAPPPTAGTAPTPVTPAQVHKLKQGTSRAGPPGSAPPAASPGYQPGP